MHHLPVFFLFRRLQSTVLRDAQEDVFIPPRLHRAQVITEDALEKVLQV
jgi:hypothetical protein